MLFAGFACWDQLWEPFSGRHDQAGDLYSIVSTYVDYVTLAGKDNLMAHKIDEISKALDVFKIKNTMFRSK